ncbi:MAG TPA: SusD/RagB family nutrient-binding outer membrane lipoprotein [Prolixibacteraceae bacterium]
MNKKIFILLISLALLGSSCSDFLTVNEVNPNSASKVPAKLILPAAINNIARTMNNPDNNEFVYLWYGLWSISSGYSQPSALVQYRLLNSSYQNNFQESYTAAQNFTEIEKVTDPKELGYKAIAMTMKAYILHTMVDLYGNVPYSEAFRTQDGILKPKYDDQKAIYEDIVLKLDEAIKIIQDLPVDATEIPASSDIIFHGDMNLWAKFANTIKLRMLVHQSGMTGRDAYIKSAIATTASVGYLGAGEGALANPGYLNSDGKMNPFYANYYKNDGTSVADGITYHNAGKAAVAFLTDNADPRIGRFFNPYSGTSFAGNTLGITDPAPLTASNTSKLGYQVGVKGTMIGTFDKSAPILTDFESLFIQAEAAQRGYITGSAKDFYNAAITQSFIYMGLTAAEATTFLGTEKNAVNFDLAPNKINLILAQKWASLNGINAFEIWTDYRRSGIPSTLTFSADPNRANAAPPVRLLYPQREISVNNDNVVAVGEIDAFTSKIFWQNR